MRSMTSAMVYFVPGAEMKSRVPVGGRPPTYGRPVYSDSNSMTLAQGLPRISNAMLPPFLPASRSPADPSTLDASPLTASPLTSPLTSPLLCDWADRRAKGDSAAKSSPAATRRFNHRMAQSPG